MHIEWLRFLRKIEHVTLKSKELHLICYNYATHKHPKILDWMSRHKRIHLHSPTSASWLNMVERFFRDISDQRLCRGVFTSVSEFEAAIDNRLPQQKFKAGYLDSKSL